MRVQGHHKEKRKNKKMKNKVPGGKLYMSISCPTLVQPHFVNNAEN